MATALEVLAECLPEVGDVMSQAAAARRATGNPKEVDESVLKRSVRDVAAARAGAAGLGFEDHERPVKPPHWPRAGRVDLVMTPVDQVALRPTPTHAFIELKWGAKDALWNCIWDIAKNALVRRLGLVDQALVLGGFADTAEWDHRKYGQLLSSRSWNTHDYLTSYRSDWRYWARPPKPSEADRTGPYELPRSFRTELVARHSFRYEGMAWSLGLVQVVPTSDELIPLDEYAKPL